MPSRNLAGRFCAISLLAFSVLFLLASPCSAQKFISPVNKHQVIPVPLRIEGLGNMIGLAYLGQRLFSEGNLLAGQIVSGQNISFAYLYNMSLPVFNLKLAAGTFNAENLSAQSSFTRGMEETKPYTMLQDMNGTFIDFASLLNQDIFFINGGYFSINKSIRGVQDEHGDNIEIPHFNKDYINLSAYYWRFHLNFTDSYEHPKVGAKMGYNFLDTHANSLWSSTWVEEVFIKYYIPIGRYLVFTGQWSRSFSIAPEQKNTDSSDIGENIGINCSEASDQVESNRCEAFRTRYMNFIQAGNSYGSSIPLGGPDKMRSTFFQRYQGSKTEYFGYELRYTEPSSNQGYTLEYALIFESGRTFDEALEETQKTSFLNARGIGVRAYDKTLVVRADWVMDDNGSQGFSLTLGHPW